ncbi:MAG: GNAT family N-acetyltransferase [Candidatus Eremiobacteraeota bacterium]|nr:GNAT family N-acetyltransferase [Candidatus Eremiobacteraeota bacterium]
MIDSALVLEGPGVRLEPIERRHLIDLRKNCADPVLWELVYGTNPFLTEDDTNEWVSDATAGGDRLAFAIVDRATNETIGSTRFADIQPEHRKLEIGWTFIAQRYWRTHVNTECKYLLLEYAFERWNAQRVQLKAEAINTRSRNAILRIGATFEGTLRSFRIKPENGEIRDTSFYSIIAPEWPSVKKRLAERLHTPVSSQS